jgi:hypothetical protein
MRDNARRWKYHTGSERKVWNANGMFRFFAARNATGTVEFSPHRHLKQRQQMLFAEQKHK